MTTYLQIKYNLPFNSEIDGKSGTLDFNLSDSIRILEWVKKEFKISNLESTATKDSAVTEKIEISRIGP